MAMNLFLGLTMMTVCVVIQCFVVAFLMRVLHILDGRRMLRPTLAATSFVLTAVLLIMMAGNLLQMAAWAGLFMGCGEYDEFRVAFYHSVVNYTTLGYGDLVMSEENRLLGGLEAANGVLMFGLTTSLSFVVLSRLMKDAWENRQKWRQKITKGKP